eukprot:Seg214.1 transcript_id=Seg214.1/GoldUCD/mRNA.D3Y31 product="Cholesterol oxidase" protein_id=Seg214.1/GoldUCD/D3Y31
MGCCSSTDKRYIQYKYCPLTKPQKSIKQHYNVVVIGSGYGGAVAACRSARAGQSVCVFEKGLEWLPGDFPETMEDSFRSTHVSGEVPKKSFGNPSNLFQFNVSKGLTVMNGCGVGGSSLTDEGIALDCKASVFYDPVWPDAFREDLDNFKTYDRGYAEQMLRPRPYPDDYPAMKRINQLRAIGSNIELVDIEDINESFFRTPLFINFEDASSNHVGKPQSACNGCGNCLSGCNTGAKNTVAMNYLPDAVQRGAEIFTQIEVTAVLKDYESYQWQIFYRHLDENAPKEEKSIRANIVIISAGSLGSTKILSESNLRGLEVSSELGRNFYTNGGIFGVSYNGKEASDAIGLPTGMFKGKPKPKDGPAPGPTATALLDVRKRRDGFVMHDVAVPGSLAAPYVVASAIAAGELQPNAFPSGPQWNGLLQRLGQAAAENTLGLYCMTSNDSPGEILFDKNTKNISVDWDPAKHKKYYYTAEKALKEAVNILGGHHAVNPQWSSQFGSGILTRHPIGGCGMGNTGLNGVVNDRGQVFIGDSDDTYDGLFVVDGSIIPCVLGVNPAFTITCIAERCMRLLALDEKWTTDYSLPAPGTKRPDHTDTSV